MAFDDLTYIEAVLKSPLAKFITFAANDCVHSGSACDFILNWFHKMLLKAKAVASN